MGICNAAFNIPENSKYPEKMHDLIRHMLTPNPIERPGIFDIIYILDNWDMIKDIKLSEGA